MVMYKNDRISTSFTVEQSHIVACSLAFFFFLELLGDRTKRKDHCFLSLSGLLKGS